MKSFELKNLIKDCIAESSINEGAESFFSGGIAGGIAGFITSWAQKHRPKSPEIRQKSLNKIANAASDYQDSLIQLKTALEPFAGSTTEEKYESFINNLSSTSFDHLKNIQRKRRKV